MSVRLIRIFGGEELLAKVTDNEDGTISLKNPAVLLPMGEGKLAFAPWLPYVEDEEITLKNEHIVFSLSPAVELMNQYNSTIGNGLVVAQGNAAGMDLTQALRSKEEGSLSDDMSGLKLTT
jgi:hypothetical protein